ncbi:MAG: NADH-quinone oxidoreductase subunit NuoG, partial [Nitrospinota bacterium]
MPALTIDGKPIEAREGEVVLAAALRHGVHIAHFCWHPELSIVSQCRACLVEVEGVPKLQPACSTPVREGMVVKSHSPRAAAAQEGVFEFLLFNHPLDCPVCDQGGECPLQDQTMTYAKGRTRSREPRRVYEKKPISPYIEPEMNRCVHCSRCIRFSLEVDGGGEFGFVRRGDRTEVGTFEGRPLASVVSGNVIDICPVGALTDKRYRFSARVWEMRETPNPCTLCSVGCCSRVWTREGRIKRVTAGENGAVNDCWICDVGRFGWSAAESGARLAKPMLREGDRLVPVSWREALERVARGFREALRAGGSRVVGAIGGARATNEAAYALGRLFRGALGSNNLDCRIHPRERAQSEAQLAAFGRTGWEAPLAGLDAARCVFLMGSDPFEELPILALRIRKAYTRAGARLLSAHTRRVDLRVYGHMEHLIHRPGAEAHLLRAVARCAFDAGAAPEGPGGEAYRRALEGAGLASLLARAGVEEAQVRRAAEALLKEKPAYLIGGPGLWEEAACRELVNLALLTGAKVAFGHLPAHLQGALDKGLH